MRALKIGVAGLVMAVMGVTAAVAQTVYVYPDGSGNLYAPGPDGRSTWFWGDGSGNYYGHPNRNGGSVWLWGDGSGGHHGRDHDSGTLYYADPQH